MTYYVYEIKIDDVVRYIGTTNNLKRRQTQHNYLLRKGHTKELYEKIRLYSNDKNIVLDVRFETNNKTEAMRYEALLILKDWFDDKKYYQTPPTSFKYHF